MAGADRLKQPREMLSKGFIGHLVLNPQTLAPASILSDFQAIIESSKAGSPSDPKITGAPLRLAFPKWAEGEDTAASD